MASSKKPKQIKLEHVQGVPVQGFHTFEPVFMREYVSSLKPCPVCGNKTFIKVRASLTLLNMTYPHVKEMTGEVAEPNWATGPYTMGCSFKDCMFKGSGEFYDLTSLGVWWNKLPRLNDYGMTWDKQRALQEKAHKIKGDL